jgi:hypothetical protein
MPAPGIQRRTEMTHRGPCKAGPGPLLRDDSDLPHRYTLSHHLKACQPQRLLHWSGATRVYGNCRCGRAARVGRGAFPAWCACVAACHFNALRPVRHSQGCAPICFVTSCTSPGELTLGSSAASAADCACHVPSVVPLRCLAGQSVANHPRPAEHSQSNLLSHYIPFSLSIIL